MERVYDDSLTDVKRDYVTESGSRLKKLYLSFIDDSGSLELRESGVENLYEYIQSFKDEVDLNNIIARFANGDVSALNKYKGFFADVSELPSTYAGFLDIQAKAGDIFAKLSPADREKFDFDVNKFIASFGTPEFLELFKADSPAEIEPIVKEVIDNEQKSE